VPVAKRAQYCRGEQVTGPVVKRLCGERTRVTVGCGFDRGDAARGLYEAIEATPHSPWSGPTPGAELGHDQVRTSRQQCLGRQTVLVERSRPVADHHDIGRADKVLADLQVIGCREIQQC
jgi:hypothetical protein